jgi:tetratricopeptide (TPR) repeat protein
MMMTRILLAAIFLCSAAFAKKALTLQEAISDAESALDNGRVGDAIATAERLQKSKGLSKEEQARVELIIGRCKLVEGQYGESEKLLAKRLKAAPEDTRLVEWYARALDGNGKGEAAFALLKDLAKKDALAEGDSYWALAKLERQKGDTQEARVHAKLALEKPIVLQSEELEQAIHKFIDELSGKGK